MKAFHIIAVIAWMAGMLYLPRLFVYHCEAEPGSQQSETFKVMERRLLKVIINPAMIVDLGARAVAGLGGRLVLRRIGCRPSSFWSLALSGLHGFFVRWVRDFAADQTSRPRNSIELSTRYRHFS